MCTFLLTPPHPLLVFKVAGSHLCNGCLLLCAGVETFPRPLCFFITNRELLQQGREKAEFFKSLNKTLTVGALCSWSSSSPFLFMPMPLPIVAMLVCLPALGADRTFPEQACRSASPWELSLSLRSQFCRTLLEVAT